MALSPYLYWPLAISGWLSVLAAVTVTLPYLLGVRNLTNGWPLTAEKALAAFSFFRYWRFWVHGLSYCYLYKPSLIPDSPSYTADKDITVIVPTVEPGNSTFGRCLDSICANGPFRIVVITVGAAMHQMAEEALAPIRRAHPSANIEVHHIKAANKRLQIYSGYRVKFQSDVGTETVAASLSASDCVVGIANLGEYPRFLQQCIRWERTSFRSNPRSLLSARAWRRHPWSMYGVQLATITNFAVLGDGLQIYLYLQTAWWADGQGQWGLVCLVAWMLLTKLVKLIPWLWRYPADIVFLPAYLGFAYYHSWIKLHALLTFWNLEWAGRDLEKINDMALK
ncbi:uncharacterized protein PG998_002931 [Apiospora kogelbergensis]|uniref:uncharacterized protein n=1 Tax=Apiospora kogelbergensis TaxID=1337665 RepID=UPI003131B333